MYHCALLFYEEVTFMASVIIIPVSSLLRNLWPSSRFAHDDTVHAENRIRSLCGQFDSPILGSERVVNFMTISLKSSVGFRLKRSQRSDN
jgi:hypothetical protein